MAESKKPRSKPRSKPRYKPWENRVEEYPMNAEVPLGMWLSSLGREGWELVTVIHHPSGEHLYTAFLKRQEI